jgi:peroxiredoxin
MPSTPLAATDGTTVNLASLRGPAVVCFYPRKGKPGVPNSDGWDLIPGARGCTPQACSFRDHFAELKTLGVDHLFGLSTEDMAYQREAAERLHRPFPIIADKGLRFTRALRLPAFETSGITLLKRLTLVVHQGTIEPVFYPEFPPDQNAMEVVAWLSNRTRS